MIPDANSKPESSESDPEQLARLLEIQLAQKRAAWKDTGARVQKIRTLSFVFLFILVIGSLAAFFFLMTQLNERRSNSPAPANPAASP
jgi:hypothetical protein